MIFIYSQSFEVFTLTLSVSLFLIFLLFFGFLNLTFQVEMESISKENDKLLAQRQVERKLWKRPSTISSWV